MKNVTHKNKVLSLKNEPHISECRDFFQALAVDYQRNAYAILWPITDSANDTCNWDQYEVKFLFNLDA